MRKCRRTYPKSARSASDKTPSAMPTGGSPRSSQLVKKLPNFYRTPRSRQRVAEGSGDTIRARAYRAKDGRSGQAACCFDTDVVPGAWHCGFSRRFHLHVEGEAAVVAQSVIDVRPGRADVIFAALSFGCPGSCARLPLRPDNNCPFHCERAPKVHFPWRSPKITATSPRLLSARCPAADLTTPARIPLGRTQARRDHSVEAREQASTH